MYQVIFFSSTGFANEGDWIYGPENEVSDFWDTIDSQKQNYASEGYFETIKEAEKVAKAKRQEDIRKYKGQRTACLIGCYHIDDFKENYGEIAKGFSMFE